MPVHCGPVNTCGGCHFVVAHFAQKPQLQYLSAQWLQLSVNVRVKAFQPVVVVHRHDAVLHHLLLVQMFHPLSHAFVAQSVATFVSYAGHQVALHFVFLRSNLFSHQLHKHVVHHVFAFVCVVEYRPCQSLHLRVEFTVNHLKFLFGHNQFLNNHLPQGRFSFSSSCTKR